jgi:hypothetical protein
MSLVIVLIKCVSVMIQVDPVTSCATLDPAKAVANRLSQLSNLGLITLSTTTPIQLQLMGDACNVWRSTHTSGTSVVIKVIYNDNNTGHIEGRGVNSVSNNVLIAFWLGDDTHESMTAACSDLPARLTAMVNEGVMVGNIRQPVKLCMGGDLKFLMSMLGLCGCSSNSPCPHCYCHKKDMDKGAAFLATRDGLPLKMRTYEAQMQLSHTPTDSPYACPACKKMISTGLKCLPEEGNESARRSFQQDHSGTRPGYGPKVLRIRVYACLYVCVYAFLCG